MIDLIKGEMLHRRITQEDLARLAGVSEPCLHRLLARKSKPRLATVERVLDALGYELRVRRKKRKRIVV